MSLWSFEGDAADTAGRNQGEVVGRVSYSAGAAVKVASARARASGYVNAGNAASLQSRPGRSPCVAGSTRVR